MSLVRIFKARDKLLIDTHEPPFRSPTWAVGSVVEHEGHLYRVTRWVELPPVVLDRGGSVGQWEVWGRRVSNRQLRREVIDAAEAILDTDKPAEE